MATPTIQFTKAEKKDSYLKIAITGPSGSGKTYGALGLATCFGKKIAVIDTENGSASLYSDKFNFDVLNIDPPYEVKKYIQAIDAAVEAGYEILVIDSLSHVWAGSGGLLEKKTALDSTGKGNSYTNWASITKDHETLLAKLLHSKIHLIGTMRSKQGYSLEEDAKGKKVPKKIGFEPIQRDGMEYEFTVVFDLSMEHFAQVSKDRTDLFDGQVFKLDRRVGKSLLDWLKGPQEPKKEAAPKEATQSVETKPLTNGELEKNHHEKTPEEQPYFPEPPFDEDDLDKALSQPKDPHEALKINTESIGEKVMVGGEFASVKIKAAWSLTPKKALEYAGKVKKAVEGKSKVSDSQLLFVDYGLAKGFLPSNFMELTSGKQ